MRFILLVLLLISQAVTAELPRPLGSWSFEQGNNWQGKSEEVIDNSTNNLHGIAIAGASTKTETPAIAGKKGSCAYLNLATNDQS